MSALVSVDVLSGGAAYLWDPPTNSWVSSVASLFFILGLLVASPIFLLLALDFTSYAIVRTLGIEHAHPVSSKATLSIITTTGTGTGSSPSSSSTPSPVQEKHTEGASTVIILEPSTTPSSKLSRPKNVSIPQSLTMDQVQPFFTTPGGANLELEGLFSPPESRTPSPPASGTTDSPPPNSNSSDVVHLDHQGQGTDAAPHLGDKQLGTDWGQGAASDQARQGLTPRSQAPPAGVERKGLGDETDALGLLRRRKPAPPAEHGLTQD